MALTDTFVKLTINTAHPTYASLTAAQLQHIYLQIGHASVEYTTYMPMSRETIGGITGMAGHSSRLNAMSSRDIVIGVNGYYMPITSIFDLNVTQKLQLAELIRNGVVVATVHNKGITTGSVGAAWYGGFNLLWDEMNRTYLYPRLLWNDINAIQTPAPTGAGAEEFYVYFPAISGTPFVIETSIVGNPTYTLDLYGYNPIDDEAVLIDQWVGLTSGVTRMTEERYPYMLPLISAIALPVGTETVDIKVGLGLRHGSL